MTSIVHETLSDRREVELDKLRKMEEDLLPLVEQGREAQQQLEMQREAIEELCQAMDLFDLQKSSAGAVESARTLTGRIHTDLRGD